MRWSGVLGDNRMKKVLYSKVTIVKNSLESLRDAYPWIQESLGRLERENKTYNIIKTDTENFLKASRRTD